MLVQMANKPFVVAASHLCNSRGKSLSQIARKCDWSESQVRRLFQPDAQPSERMLKELARELSVDIATLRKLADRSTPA
jgi:transcriptional regulator with XRE-family HTH domain